jgi:uncharacterized protein (TIGR02145 family)
VKNVLITTIFVLSFAVAFGANQTTIKFYMNDGSPVQEVNIDDIAKLEIKKVSNNFTMSVYYKKDSSASYQTSSIDTMNFSTNGNNQKLFNFYISGNTKSYFVSDIDSIIFIQNQDNSETVTIGNQVWMVRNLDVTHYRNGVAIRYAATNAEWIDAAIKKEGAWCYYNNDPANGAIYGKLYSWYAVNDTRGLAPSGYHIPSVADWTTLENYLKSFSQYWCNNNSSYIAKSLSANELWHTINTTCTIGNNLNANNSSGFSALPGGYRDDDGAFSALRSYGYWWANDRDESGAFLRYLRYNGTNLGSSYYYKNLGLSVRCFREVSKDQGDTIVIYLKNENVEKISIDNVEKIDFKLIVSDNQNVSLNQGWNIISTYVEPQNPSMPVIWNDIKSFVNLVKNNAGQSYIPNFNINQIGNWNKYEGYQVSMKEQKTLTLAGIQIIPDNTPISLTSGWKIVPYIRNSPMFALTALATLTSQNALTLCKNSLGQSYIPQFNIN